MESRRGQLLRPAGLGERREDLLAADCLPGGWWERRVPYPLLDLRFLRVPRFVTANVVAFCGYFATFAIFFFTALYLEEVAGYSGYRIALAFLPMATLMILTSLLVGRWASAAAQRWFIVGGCLLFGTGLLLTNACLSPQPPYVPLVAPPGEGALVQQVIQAAYTAFEAGLHAALYLSAGLVLGAGVLAAALALGTHSAAGQRPWRPHAPVEP